VSSTFESPWWYRQVPRDFMSSPDVELMTAEEIGSYFLLLQRAWLSGENCTLPNDPARLARLAHELLPSMIGQIRKGTVRNLEHFAKRVVRLHARRKQAGVLNGTVSDIEHDPAQRAFMNHAAKFAPSSNRSLQFASGDDGAIYVHQTMGKKCVSLSAYDKQEQI
jgi:hypothetical protein